MKYLLFISLLFCISCDSSSSSPAIAKSVITGGGDDPRGKTKPPEEGVLKVSVFSFDDLGNNIIDIGDKKKDIDINKIEFLQYTVVEELFQNNDIVVFNNIIGGKGDSHFRKIVKGLSLVCGPTTPANNLESNTYVCARDRYFKVEYPEKKKSYNISDLKVKGFEALTSNGFHASVSLKSGKIKFNLVAVNLIKEREEINSRLIRSKQIDGLIKYMKSPEMKSTFMDTPTLIIGDWQNLLRENVNVGLAASELAEYLGKIKNVIPIGLYSPKKSTEIEGDFIFNHLFYSANNWLVNSDAIIGGKCPNNFTDEEKDFYKVNQSKFCPTSFTLKYAVPER